MEPFVYPIAPAPRTAVLVSWFSKEKFGKDRFSKDRFGSRSLRVFADGWGAEAAAFEPAAIAGTYQQLRANPEPTC